MCMQLEGTEGEEARSQVQEKVDEAATRMQKASKQLEGVRKAAMPKVEVGSLEEVITKMENDTNGDWNAVMFVPAGSVDMKPPS